MANKRNNKSFWIIAIVLILGAIFVLGNFDKLTGQQFRSRSDSSKIRAHSCDADSVCETNSLKAIWIDAGKGAFRDLVTVENSERRGRVRTDSLEAIWINAAGKGSFRDLEAIWIDAGKGSFTDSLRGEYLSGNGTAYVCVDGNGRLFRSQIPCV